MTNRATDTTTSSVQYHNSLDHHTHAKARSLVVTAPPFPLPVRPFLCMQHVLELDVRLPSGLSAGSLHSHDSEPAHQDGSHRPHASNPKSDLQQQQQPPDSRGASTQESQEGRALLRIPLEQAEPATAQELEAGTSIAPNRAQIWAKARKPNCTECHGCTGHIQPLQKQVAFGRNFSVEQVGSHSPGCCCCKRVSHAM